MKFRAFTLSLFMSAPVAVLAFSGCSSSGESQADGAGGAGGAEFVESSDGGGDSAFGGGGAGANEASCVPSGSEDIPDPRFSDSNCDGIDGDAQGAVFVSPLGDDAAEGTMDAPLATLTEAMGRATLEGKDVYACSATYDENLVIDQSLLINRKIRIYGGFACEDGWARTKTPVEVAPNAGIPISILDLADGEETASVRIENFVFRASDAVGAGESSIAGRIVRSSEVTLSRVVFIAGAGADAGDAALAPEFSKAAAAGKDGANAPSASSMFGSSCYTYVPPPPGCTGPLCVGTSVWKSSCRNIADDQPKAWRCSGNCKTSCETDEGGAVTVSRSYGGHGSTPYSSPSKPSGKGTRNENVSGAGSPGADGEPAQSGFGSVSDTGEYLASNVGSVGKFGKVGKNGRGGDGAPFTYQRRDLFYQQVGGAGGSSGVPGCGGRPGSGGLAGGASIGLIIVDSAVILERVTVTTSDGGKGGRATAGAAGQTGGAGGKGGDSRYNSGTHAGNELWGGKNGEKGGNGGRGGDGGAGGGGPSLGIVVVGTEPSLTAMTFDIGLGGEGGERLEGSDAAAGPAGASDDVYVVE